MRFEPRLERGLLVSRYKRFFAEVVLGGEAVLAHCPNPGAMIGLSEPGLSVWVSRASGAKRKLAYTLEMVETQGALVGVNTLHPNRLAQAAIAAGEIPELRGYAGLRREVRYDGDSRIDILLEQAGRPPAFVEVKSGTLSREPGLAEFPDCVTARGAKHLAALERTAASGARAVMLFVIQRNDCRVFDTADDIDPAYGAALRRAALNGVEVLCYRCHLSPEAITLADAIPWRSRPTATE